METEKRLSRKSLEAMPDSVRLKSPKAWKDPRAMAVLVFQIILTPVVLYTIQKAEVCAVDATGVMACTGHPWGMGEKSHDQAVIIMFTLFIGLGVGMDVDFDQFKDVMANNKRAFVLGSFCQFIMMPLYGLICTLVFENAFLYHDTLSGGFYRQNDWDPTHKGLLEAAVGAGNVPAWNTARDAFCADVPENNIFQDISANPGGRGDAGRQDWLNAQSAKYQVAGAYRQCFYENGPQGQTIHRDQVYDGTYTEGDGPENVTWIPIPQFNAVLILGLVLAASCPGGTTSNAFTLLNKGDVALSVTMSIFSNLCALFWMPLNIILFYDLRFGGGDGLGVDYMSIIEPLVILISGLVGGMLLKVQCSGQQGLTGNPWPESVAFINSRVAILIANVFIWWGIIRTLKIYCADAAPGLDLCQMIAPNPAFIFTMVMLQPVGAGIGWGLATLNKQGVRQRIAISYETGIQAFGVAIAISLLGFEGWQADFGAMLYGPHGPSGCGQPVGAGAALGLQDVGGGFVATCTAAVACTADAVNAGATITTTDAAGVETVVDNACHAVVAMLAPDGQTTVDPAAFGGFLATCGSPHAFGTSYCPYPFNMLPIMPGAGGNPSLLYTFLFRFFDSALFPFWGAVVYLFHLVWMFFLFGWVRDRCFAHEFEVDDEVEDSKA